MMHRFKTVLLAAVLLLCQFSLKAQYRIGGIDTEALLLHLPNVLANRYDSILNTYQDSLNKELAKREAAVNREAEKFNSCHDCPPPAASVRASMREQFIRLIQNVQQFQDTIQVLTEKKADALRRQLLDIIKERVKVIAFESGYDIIIDICADKIYPLPHCNDVTALVLEKLRWQ